ncbi:MAG: IS1380 family transposase [Deltaproteobacteria bacterium]|nr:IS1380 family transposase [Deltaproteobacteria bacterium]
MKARVRQQLRQFQLRIERRIDRENANIGHDGQPVLRGTGALYEISDRVRAVAAGGVALIHRMVQATGLDKEIDKRVHLLRFHLPYEESDHVTNIAYNLLAGGECLEHLELLRNDENYLDMLGARRIPDPTTAGDFCRRFKTPEDVDSLQDAINEARLRVWGTQPDEFFEHAQIDADGTIVEASDCTEGADFSYKKTFGFQPLVITLANTREVLFLENRAASRPSHEGAAARLDQAVDLVRRAGFRRVTLRGDTDFSQTKFLDGWNKNSVEFVFGYQAGEKLVERADSLKESAWARLERDGRYEIKTAPRARPTNVREQAVVEREYHNIHLVHEHVSEFDHRPTKCNDTYRMVVVRKLLTHEQGQKLLYPEIRYFFYITNRRDISAREVVRLANTRCDQERVIGQQKSDVRSLRAPLDNLHSNWAYMVSATLAWNLAKWFALLLPEKGRWKEKHADEKDAVLRMNFGTFVSAFMRIPAQLMRGARQVRLRLLSWNPWQRVFFRALDSVRAIS